MPFSPSRTWVALVSTAPGGPLCRAKGRQCCRNQTLQLYGGSGLSNYSQSSPVTGDMLGPIAWFLPGSQRWGNTSWVLHSSTLQSVGQHDTMRKLPHHHVLMDCTCYCSCCLATQMLGRSSASAAMSIGVTQKGERGLRQSTVDGSKTWEP